MAVCMDNQTLGKAFESFVNNKEIELSVEQLVNRSKQGDQEAFGILAGKHYSMGFATAYSITGRREDAEDICQEAMIKAFRNIHSLRNSKKFGAWLRSIVKQEAYGRLRMDKRIFEGIKLLIWEKQTEPSHTEVHSDKHLYQQELFEMSINSLSVKMKEIALLFYMNGLSIEDISRQMELSAGTVKTQLFRARKRMLQTLNEAGLKSMDDL